MSQARDLNYPRWATDGSASVVEPNEGRKDGGFLADDEADEAEFNWLHRSAYRSIRWLDEDHLGREMRGTTTWYEPTFTYAIGASLTQALTGGVVVRLGTRLHMDAAWLASIGQSNHTFTASRDTYVGVSDERAMVFVEVANGGPTPAAPAGYTFLFYVVTDGVGVTAVTSRASAGPIMAPANGIRIAPHLILGLGGAVPPVQAFDVGTLAATADLERVVDGYPASTSAFYVRRWTRASNTLLEILVGSPPMHSVGDTDTNAITKTWNWSLLHYLAAEEPVGLVHGVAGVATSVVAIGGGAAQLNAATSVQLWAAATNAVTSGTMLLEIQGATSIVHCPAGVLNLGDGIAGTPILRLNRVNLGEGGIEMQEAGSRRWLASYSPNTSDDLVWWRFNGVTDNGVSLRVQWSTGLVQVETDAGFRVRNADGSTTRGIRCNTHVGAETGTFDSEEWEWKTKVVETNTNGNEDLILIPVAQLGIQRVFMIELLIVGVELGSIANVYSRRIVTIYARAGGVPSNVSTLEDTGVAGGVGGWPGTASAGVSLSGSDLVLRVTAANTTVRRWTVSVRWGVCPN